MSKQNSEVGLKHLFDGSDWNVYDDSIINLGVGAPNSDLLKNCCEIFKIATEHRLRYERDSNSSLLFQYGPPSGIYEVRSAIAKYFSEKYESKMKSEDLFITSGATQGLNFVLSTLIDPNGYIFVDEVTYMIALDTIKQLATFKIVTIPLTDDGTDLEQFQKILKELKCTATKTTKTFWSMYYTIPTFHNPTGILFSDKTCQSLVKLAREHDFLILCDDVYNILNYNVKPTPKRLFAYDNPDDANFSGHVISNSSFSKIIAPGIRLGWLEVPARLKPILEDRSGGCLNNYMSGVVASLFELGLAQKHIQLMYEAYKERMVATRQALTEGLPQGCRMLPSGGGYFIWICLPQHASAEDFLQYCLREEKIYFIPGARFSVNCEAKNCFRISIAFHNKTTLLKAADKLCRAIRSYLAV